MSAKVISLSRPVPGQSRRAATLRKRKDREILLARVEEHRRKIAQAQAEIACSACRIAELLAELRALDGYPDLDWGDAPSIQRG